MDITKVRRVIRHVPSFKWNIGSKEASFSRDVIRILPSTNYELLGEELILKNNGRTWKCDLWLANVPNCFLMSLELKVGKYGNLNKRSKLNEQVYNYSNIMRSYYPEYVIHGLGAYKVENVDSKCFHKVLYFENHHPKITNDHLEEIEELKYRINNIC